MSARKGSRSVRRGPREGAGDYWKRALRNIWKQTERRAECLVWTGNVSTSGYGRVTIDGARFYVHRLVRSIVDGTPYREMHVHHTCGTRVCVEPRHLQVLSAVEHGRFHRPPPIRCRRGHSMDDAYIRPDGKGRQCRTCIRERCRKYHDNWQRNVRRAPKARPCVVCTKEFTPKRKHRAECCGDTCRHKRWRAHQGVAHVDLEETVKVL